MLKSWRLELEAAGSAAATAAQKGEAAELVKLRRDNKRLTEEVEVLRKASAFSLNGGEDMKTKHAFIVAHAYAAIGADISPLVEIDVKAHKRVIRRPRWRRACGCASSPIEVSAPPVPRLFRNTPYGISVWACVLFERYACYRPLKRVAAWLSDRALPISPGTLADSMLRFVPLFEPVAGAILAERPRGAADTTGTSSTTSPGRTSGFGPCEEIGSEPSIGKIHRPIPARPNLYRIVTNAYRPTKVYGTPGDE